MQLRQFTELDRRTPEWSSLLAAVNEVHPGSRSHSRYEFLIWDSKVKPTVVNFRFFTCLVQ